MAPLTWYDDRANAYVAYAGDANADGSGDFLLSNYSAGAISTLYRAGWGEAYLVYGCASGDSAEYRMFSRAGAAAAPGRWNARRRRRFDSRLALLGGLRRRRRRASGPIPPLLFG